MTVQFLFHTEMSGSVMDTKNNQQMLIDLNKPKLSSPRKTELFWINQDLWSLFLVLSNIIIHIKIRKI